MPPAFTATEAARKRRGKTRIRIQKDDRKDKVMVLVQEDRATDAPPLTQAEIHDVLREVASSPFLWNETELGPAMKYLRLDSNMRKLDDSRQLNRDAYAEQEEVMQVVYSQLFADDENSLWTFGDIECMFDQHQQSVEEKRHQPIERAKAVLAASFAESSTGRYIGAFSIDRDTLRELDAQSKEKLETVLAETEVALLSMLDDLFEFSDSSSHLMSQS